MRTKAKPVRRILLILAALLAAAVSWALLPGANAGRPLDPVAVARAETGLWRAYYERRHFALVVDLMLNEHRLFGLSPVDSARSGLAAAEAARTFQRSRSRAEAQAALAPLTRHFAVKARSRRAAFDAGQAARLELEWWQLRREDDAGPAVYAPAVAAAAAYVYGLDPGRLAEYARLRAEAMDLRDRLGAKITDDDWARIEVTLVEAYEELRRATTLA